MSFLKLNNLNSHVAQRCGQGTPHNTGIKMRDKIEKAGHEIKMNPPKILVKTAKKFGKKRAQSQKTAIMLSKARKMGANIPAK
jgi:hypothetical protein